MAVFDLPARASATNFLQFNGSHSCLYCFDKGVHVAHRQLFLPDEDHRPRSKATIERHGRKAERKGTTVFGVKGKSILSSSIDIVQAVPVDYMHAALEGISRRLLSVCLDSKNHARRFYLGRATEEIDKRLKQIKPLLVSAMHTLLGDAIPSADIIKANTQLELFYSLVPELYGEVVCTANMHTLIHLAQFVLDWGPLWGYSCFGFESMNGHLRKSCHGTGYVLPQLVHTVRMRQMLLVKGKKMADRAGPNTAAFINSLAGTRDSVSGLDVKGRVTHKKIEGSVLVALKGCFRYRLNFFTYL